MPSKHSHSHTSASVQFKSTTPLLLLVLHYTSEMYALRVWKVGSAGGFQAT